MKYLFDDKEDSRFSAIVLEYNSQEEGSNEKLKLENTVKERTKVLLYLIPQRYLFVPEEDASAFFMDSNHSCYRIRTGNRFLYTR